MKEAKRWLWSEDSVENDNSELGKMHFKLWDFAKPPPYLASVRDNTKVESSSC